MILNRRYKLNLQSETYSMPILLTHGDLKRVLYKLGEELHFWECAQEQGFWEEYMGVQLTSFVGCKPLKCSGDVGKWGFSQATKKGFLLPDSLEENLYYINPKLKDMRPGPVSGKSEDED